MIGYHIETRHADRPANWHRSDRPMQTAKSDARLLLASVLKHWQGDYPIDGRIVYTDHNGKKHVAVVEYSLCRVEALAKEEVDKAYHEYEAVNRTHVAGSIEGQKAYTAWSDALDRYNDLRTKQDSIVETLKKAHDQGGSSWNDIDDPDAMIAEMRE